MVGFEGLGFGDWRWMVVWLWVDDEDVYDDDGDDRSMIDDGDNGDVIGLVERR